MNNKAIGILALTVVAVSANAAISFSNISTPSGVTATVAGSGISFKANNFFFGAGTRSFTVTYTVTSGLGILTNAQLSNSGTIKNADFTATITHSSDKTLFATANSTPSLITSKGIEFVDAASYNVTLVVEGKVNVAPGYVNAKTTNVAYNEAVPEPASMAALALGFGLIAKRRIRK